MIGILSLVGAASMAVGSDEVSLPEGKEPDARNVIWELWRDWPGDSVLEVVGSERWAMDPIRSARIPGFESGRDIMDDFGVRMRARIMVPESGAYRFVLDVEGSAVVFLDGVGKDPSRVVAATDGAAVGQPVDLGEGDQIDLTLLHKGGEGPDSVLLRWIPPGGEEPVRIPDEVLQSFAALETVDGDGRFQSLIRPMTKEYDRGKHLARDRHRPRPDIHLTRETVYAAGALIESDDPADWEEAARALRKVLPYQDIDPDSPHFGNWPKTVERPGDFRAQNIGGFIGEELIVILSRHRDRLPPDLIGEMEDALRRAALRSVRYDPPVTATNIVTKAVAVALVADAMLGVPEAREWGVAKLGELHSHTLASGMPSEYNSPTYNRVSMEALALLKEYLEDPLVRSQVEDLYDAAWLELAANYHPNLQLWIGPSVRRYQDRHTPGARLQEGSANEWFFGVPAFARVPQPAPPFVADFVEPLVESETRRIPVQAPASTTEVISQESTVPQVATLHLDPDFAIGSFNRSDLWDQRRPVIAHWGRRDAPGFLRVESPSTPNGLLPVQVYAAQDGPRVLLVFDLATDAGWGVNPWDLHYQPRDAVPEVSDVRVRLFSAGPASIQFRKTPASVYDPAVYRVGDVSLGLRLVGGDFNGEEPGWNVTPEGHLDLILYQGPPVPLDSIREAFAVLALEMGEGLPGTDWLDSAEATVKNGEVVAEAGDLRIRAPVVPGTYSHLQDSLEIVAPAADRLIRTPMKTEP